MLFQLVADQRKSQFGGVDRCIYFLQYIWKRTNMILMTMGDHKSFHLGNILFQVGNIRNYKIDSRHVIFRKSESAIYYYYTIFILKSCNIHSNLLQTTKWNDLQLGAIVSFTWSL